MPHPAPYAIAMAAGRDAGNRSARRAGRTAWNEHDYCAAIACFAKLTQADRPIDATDPPPGPSSTPAMAAGTSRHPAARTSGRPDVQKPARKPSEPPQPAPLRRR